jgi:hypothetical protein
MLNAAFRRWLIGGWIIVLALVVTVSMSMAASLSTTLLLAALGIAPGVVIVLLKRGAASPTVAEILHEVDVEEGRR